MQFKKQTRLMGNQFEFTLIEQNAVVSEELFEIAIEEIRRIEGLLTTFSEKSVTYHINQNAGMHPVEVNEEVFQLIKRSQFISKITQGAFDLSYGSIDKRFWNFDMNMTSLPDAETAKKSVALINYENIILDENNQTVFLKNKGMRIGFGGIGKGYAAEMAKKTLVENKVKNGIVNASGDLSAWGYQENGEPWTIGVADPNQKKTLFSTFKITDKAVATSGNYEKFVLINNKRYSHTIDPKTGFPVSGIKSVTIIADNAEIADALATPVTVMGIDVGMDFINQLKTIGCIIIDDHDKTYFSKNITIT
ncbi:FAD:protein FMN transferase [Flavobacterium sp.]|uniref:FAD:protein FMN transferase n=1 Tax=Flavobacterium sp. TaxID=239 RepID=UPI002487AC8A|nr:FAD:protein FMN transferase [Flavobacterium sp.]MDI1315735.1 FAD:protein FMN transferase [Flavobacterium sp.]